MSFSDAIDSARGQQTDFLQLEKGYTTVRFLSKPVAVNRAFLKVLDKDGKEVKRSFWVYKGCGYEDEGKTKFVAYVIDAKDQYDEEKKLKVKKIEIGWKALEDLSAKEKMRKEQGIETEPFPMMTDVIISKTGDGMNTKYACDFAIKNQITASYEEVASAVIGLETIEDWRHKSTEAEKKNHAENGLPKIVRSNKEEDLPVIQTDVQDDPNFTDTRTDAQRKEDELSKLTPEERKAVESVDDIPF